MALVGLIPAGFIYPNPVVDYGLAVLLPLHGHWYVVFSPELKKFEKGSDTRGMPMHACMHLIKIRESDQSRVLQLSGSL